MDASLPLRRLANALAVLDADNLTLLQTRVLITVAASPGINDSALRKTLMIPSGSLNNVMSKLGAGRTVGTMAEGTSRRLKGAGLVTSLSPPDARSNSYFLTSKGVERLKETLKRLTEGKAEFFYPAPRDALRTKLQEFEKAASDRLRLLYSEPG